MRCDVEKTLMERWSDPGGRRGGNGRSRRKGIPDVKEARADLSSDTSRWEEAIPTTHTGKVVLILDRRSCTSY